MKKPFLYLLPILSLFFFLSCDKKKNGNPVPSIAFRNMLPNTVKSGNSEDTIKLSFRFHDGDGNLGNDPATGIYDIYTKDSRDGKEFNYFFPEGISSLIPPGDELEGNCTISIMAAFLLLRPDHPDGDTLRYEVYIKDRDGNESNHFTTPDIYITP